ncbi:MAG: hypothetical protein D6768_21145, partial [Chloroflexi bacterium]
MQPTANPENPKLTSGPPDERLNFIPHWLWSLLAGTLLVGGGVWMILSQTGLLGSEPQPVRGAAYARLDSLPGNPAPNFELAN